MKRNAANIIRYFPLFWVLSFQSSLAQIDTAWVRRYTGPQQNGGDHVTTVVVDNAGNAYVTGYSPGATTGLDFATIKYAPNGDTVWVKRFNGSGSLNDQPKALAVDHSGNVYVTGWRNIDAFSTRFGTVKYLSNGDTAWTRLLRPDGSGNDYAAAMTVDGSGNVFVTGGGESGSGLQDYITVKYNPSGDTLWLRRYNGGGAAFNLVDYATAIAVDNGGNAYVTGTSTQPNIAGHISTIKYAPNGDTVWTRHYNSATGINAIHVASDIKVDHTGNVYVTGYRRASGPDYDYVTLKYDNNGNMLWNKLYNGPSDSTDQAYDLEIDNSGNVYVVGLSRGAGAINGYTIVQYNSNGDTIWTRSIPGVNTGVPPNPDIALDESGNVYLSGHVGINPPFSLLVMKYGMNGDSLWARRDVSGNSSGHAIALDPAGNVYVTGGAPDAGGSVGRDFITVKYGNNPLAAGDKDYKLPDRFGIEQNYPNPFNPVTSFRFQVSSFGFVSLKVFDVLGREVASLVDEELHPAGYTATWVAAEFPSGVYYYRLQAGLFTQVRKMMLIK